MEPRLSGRRTKRDPYGLVTKAVDKYSILELVGIGGMSAVYRAQHLTTKGIVALKILKPDLAIENPEMVTYFIEEAVKTVGLNHPHIIRVTDAGIADDSVAFLVMEWLNGRTLQEELGERGPMPLERVSALLEQICEAMSYTHSEGIIHRDLKPNNIMIVADHRGEEAVKVLDFGIAKALDSTVGYNTGIMGAPYYASPEQLTAGANIDHRSDIYSLGVMVYQLLTGKVPFDADSMKQMIYQHLAVLPAPLREIRPEIPEAVEEAVLRALAKRADHRYDNATQLSRVLTQAISLDSGAIVLKCVDGVTDSNIAGAFIYLNGKHVGQTDERGEWHNQDVLPRQYLIEVECRRYDAWHESVRIDPREELALTVPLTQTQKGELIIRCAVPGAKVDLDTKEVGVTDEAGRLYLDSVATGDHTIRIRHPKHLPFESTVEVNVGEQSFVEVELEARPRLEIGKKILRSLGSITSSVSGALVGLSRLVTNTGRAIVERPRTLALIAACVVLAGVLLIGGRMYLNSRASIDNTPLIPDPGPPNQTEVGKLQEEVPAPPVPPVRVWESMSLEPRHDAEIWALAFSPDGTLLASADSNGTVKLWDMRTDPPTATATLNHGDDVFQIAFSPDSNVLATIASGDKLIKLWKTRTGEAERPPLEGAGYPIRWIAFLPDGGPLLSGGGDLIKSSGQGSAQVSSWDMDSGKIKKTVRRFAQHLTAYAVSPDGKELVAGSYDGFVGMWDTDTGKKRWLDPGKLLELVTAVAVSPDGKLVVSGRADNFIQIWNAGDGTLLKNIKIPRDGSVIRTAFVRSLAFSPDSRFVAIGGADRLIRFLDVESYNFRESRTLDSVPLSVAFSPDGKMLAAPERDGRMVKLFNVATLPSR